MRESDEMLLAKVNAVIQPFGCTATELGPDSVGVQGDARFYGPSVYVTIPDDMSQQEWGTIATKIINEVRGISRVLKNITPL